MQQSFVGQTTTAAPTTTTSPTVVSGGLSGLTCISGQVRLFQFFTAPTAGTVIGQLTTFSGQTIPLVQTGPTPLGGIALSSVNNQFATLCGVFTQRGGQTVFDVRVVNPGAPSPTGTPINFQQLIQLLQFLLFLQSIGFGGGFGKGFGGGFGKGLTGLQPGLGQFGKGLTGLQPSLGQFGKGLTGLQPGLGQFGKGLTGLGQFGKGLTGLGQFGKGLTGLGTTGFGTTGIGGVQ